MITNPIIQNHFILMKCNSCKHKYRAILLTSNPCPKCGSNDVGRALVNPLTFLA